MDHILWKVFLENNSMKKLHLRANFMFSISPFLIIKPYFKGALSGLRQFLATESSLKMIKNAF